jgi:hypothetical protein
MIRVVAAICSTLITWPSETLSECTQLKYVREKREVSGKPEFFRRFVRKVLPVQECGQIFERCLVEKTLDF